MGEKEECFRSLNKRGGIKSIADIHTDMLNMYYNFAFNNKDLSYQYDITLDKKQF